MAYVDVVFPSASSRPPGNRGASRRHGPGCRRTSAYSRPDSIDHRLGVRVRADRPLAAGDAPARRMCSSRRSPRSRASPRGGVRRRRPATGAHGCFKTRELREHGLAFTDVVAALRPAPAGARGVARVSLRGISSRCQSLCRCLARRCDRRRGPAARRGARREVEDVQITACARSAASSSPGARRRHRDARRRGQARGRARGAQLARRSRAARLRRRGRRPRLDGVRPLGRRDPRATTLLRALVEVGVVVPVILLLHGRSALIPLATLPVVLLMTFGAMWALRVRATS